MADNLPRRRNRWLSEDHCWCLAFLDGAWKLQHRQPMYDPKASAVGRFACAVVPLGEELLSPREARLWIEKHGYIVPDELMDVATATNQLSENNNSQAKASGQRESKPSKKRGRPSHTNPKTDQKIFEGWKMGQHKTFAAFARVCTHVETADEVRRAIDRVRRRNK